MQLNRILMENRKFFGYSQLCRSRFLYVKRHFTYSTICEWYSVIFGLGVITQRSYPHFMILTRIENRTCHIATRLVLYRQIITAEITYTLYVKTKVLYVNDTLRFSNEKLPHNIFFATFYVSETDCQQKIFCLDPMLFLHSHIEIRFHI